MLAGDGTRAAGGDGTEQGGAPARCPTSSCEGRTAPEDSGRRARACDARPERGLRVAHARTFPRGAGVAALPAPPLLPRPWGSPGPPPCPHPSRPSTTMNGLAKPVL